MASGTFRGVLCVNQPTKNGGSSATADNECAFIFTNNQGFRSTDTLAIRNVYQWSGVNEDVWQFKFTISDLPPTGSQKNWRTNSDGGTVGLAAGVFEVAITGGNSWLVVPNRIYGYYTGSAENSIVLFVTATKSRSV